MGNSLLSIYKTRRCTTNIEFQFFTALRRVTISQEILKLNSR